MKFELAAHKQFSRYESISPDLYLQIQTYVYAQLELFSEGSAIVVDRIYHCSVILEYHSASF